MRRKEVCCIEQTFEIEQTCGEGGQAHMRRPAPLFFSTDARALPVNILHLAFCFFSDE
jgi:hypothetical protein